MCGASMLRVWDFRGSDWDWAWLGDRSKAEVEQVITQQLYVRFAPESENGDM